MLEGVERDWQLIRVQMMNSGFLGVLRLSLDIKIGLCIRVSTLFSSYPSESPNMSLRGNMLALTF
jgi:hypothetical protein